MLSAVIALEYMLFFVPFSLRGEMKQREQSDDDRELLERHLHLGVGVRVSIKECRCESLIHLDGLLLYRKRQKRTAAKKKKKKNELWFS